jgi:ATP-binding cassette subfamily F protein uup
MNFLTLENISRSYGEKLLFENLSLSINEGEKVALVARNGTGKTSLLRIAAGLETAEQGQSYLRKEIKTRFLEQEPLLSPGKTVIDEVFDASLPVLSAISRYERALLHPEEKDTLTLATEEMDLLKAWDYDFKVKQILSRLSVLNLEQKVATLSGGQKKRVALAKVLIDDPDFLLLDEPTNHLDLGMIEWLENYLTKAGKTLLLVTHDREFLENVCGEIIELDEGKLYRYQGGYSYFLEKKSLREEVEQANVSKAKNLFRKELDWMRRQPKARTTKARSRIVAFYELKEKASVQLEEDEWRPEINIQRLGGKILEFHHVHKSFGPQKILADFSYKFKPRERVGLVGKNGSGKSTLLNLITGREPADSGKIVVGDTVAFGYYTQEGMQLKEEKRMIEVVKEIADFIPLLKGKTISAAQLLERFLFPSSTHYTYVSKLSGGEKRRLHLLTLLMKNPNFLILDEPTNDLDIVTLQVLEEFLLDFPGCLVLVSHDRHFMNKLVDHLFVLEGDGRLRDFPGNYNDYLLHRDSTVKENRPPKSKAETEKPAPPKNKLSYQEKREFGQLEKEIDGLEKRKLELTHSLNSGTLPYESLQRASIEFTEVEKLLDQKMQRWMELAEIGNVS